MNSTRAWPSRRLRGGILLCLATAVAACSRTPATSSAHASVSTRAPVLTEAAPSIGALVDQFVHAVEVNDEQALHRLRVTREEYLRIIVPGTVEDGQPSRQVPEESASLYWRMLDAKSRDMARMMLAHFGGRTLRHGDPRYTKGVQKYGGYTAYGQVRLPVVDEHGKELILRTGTIAEVAGGYKFIGLNWND